MYMSMQHSLVRSSYVCLFYNISVGIFVLLKENMHTDIMHNYI